MDGLWAKSQPAFPTVAADMSTLPGQNIIWDILKAHAPSYVHMSPPSGTVSRAREKVLSAAYAGLGIRSGGRGS